MTVENNVNRLRESRGISAAQLASAVGVSRQTIYAIESGEYIPNTAIALKLAQTLESRVEDLFRLESAEALPLKVERVKLLMRSGGLRAGQPVQLCAVDEQIVAVPSEPNIWSLSQADGIAVEDAKGATARLKVQVVADGWKDERRLLLAGCDPGVSVLARHLRRQGTELVIAHQNSSRALQLLKQGMVQVAGTHLRDDETGESNLSAISKMFRKDTIAVFSFTLWEEGLVVAPGNPKKIRSITDLVRKDVTITNRDHGSGSRLLLDALIRRAGLRSTMIRGYDRITPGHLAAARLVQEGKVDCCINMRATAHSLGLDFVSLVSERYDLVVRRKHLQLPSVEALFDTLSRAALRRELEGIGGYDMSQAGKRLI
ncbi:MAG: substrate-binding domain-containing protein [Terriglobales bacterium]